MIIGLLLLAAVIVLGCTQSETPDTTPDDSQQEVVDVPDTIPEIIASVTDGKLALGSANLTISGGYYVKTNTHDFCCNSAPEWDVTCKDKEPYILNLRKINLDYRIEKIKCSFEIDGQHVDNIIRSGSLETYEEYFETAIGGLTIIPFTIEIDFRTSHNLKACCKSSTAAVDTSEYCMNFVIDKSMYCD